MYAGTGESVYLPIIGRGLLALFFIFLGVIHAMHWRIQTEVLRSRNVLMPTLVLWIGIVLYLVCGFFLFFGWAVSTVAVILIIMLLLRAAVMGSFWATHADERRVSLIHFMTNIALIGALLMVI
jgi:putative oxidoreductase